MKKYKFPSITFAIATYNSERTLEACLSSIQNQEYPLTVEIVLGDGGSSDATIRIAKAYGASVVVVPIEKQNAEYNKGVAVNAAKNEIVVMIDHDNVLPHNLWLKNMIRPLVENPQVIGSGVLRFHHNFSDTLLDRYFALIGAADPVTFFLNKSAHQSWLYDSFYLKAQVIKELPGYYLVKLDPGNMPSLGGNGAVIRRELLLKNAHADPDHFFHIDVHVDLARNGFVQYSFVNDTIIHRTNNNLVPFLKRRMYYVDKYYYEDSKKRRYSVFEKEKDIFSLFLYLLYSTTFIGPLYHALRGYIKIRDVAWFLHPVLCFAMVVVYGVPTLRNTIYGTRQ